MASDFPFQELLSPYDFEILVRDLISRELGIELRAFAEGPDGGVDLRYSADPSNAVVVQCKRMSTISKKQLESEYQKIDKLVFEKYYLAVAGDLSVAKCDEIVNIFSKWMKDDSYIYTKSRLNSLLDRFPDILREHYKLWINSSQIFDQFINNDVIGRSTFLKEDIAKSLKYYVKNSNYNQAVEILNKSNIIIISGIPGIGKTTLAKILAWEYLQQDFEVDEIRSVNDGERILKEDDRKKQVLYFDDFLGENFLQYDVVQGRANDLLMFMKRFSEREDNNKKLIMTTREYILNQARTKYAKLDREEIDVTKYVLDLDQYSEVNKALILYNHLYYSSVGLEYIRNILKNTTFKKIISHRNYNPRIIEAMTNHLSEIPPGKYGDEFIANLDNPMRIWEKAFESEISHNTRYLLYLLASFGSDVLSIDLERAFNALASDASTRLNLVMDKSSFKNSLKEMQNTFIRITITKYNEHRIEFLNPSIRDFLTNRLTGDSQALGRLISSSLFLNQLLYVYRHMIKGRNDDLIPASLDRMIRYWNHFESARLISWYRDENSWHIYNYSPFEKLDYVCSEFDINQEPELRKLVLADFIVLDLSQSHNSSDFNYYLNTLKRLVQFHEFDADFIMRSYIDNISFTDQVSDFHKFANIFSDSYTTFLSKNHTDIKRTIHDIIKNDLDNTKDASDLSQLESLFDDLENNFDLSLSDERDRVLDKIGDSEENEPSPAEPLHTNASDKNTAISDIMDLFKEDMFTR